MCRCTIHLLRNLWVIADRIAAEKEAEKTAKRLAAKTAKEQKAAADKISNVDEH